MPEREYRRLTGETPGPDLPSPDASGNYPAVETMRAMLAQKLIRARRTARLTQAELAKLAGVRVETVKRLESGKHSPNVAAVDKIHAAIESKTAEIRNNAALNRSLRRGQADARAKRGRLVD
jgi:DNA-binding XRE family transcriptional regulator